MKQIYIFIGFIFLIIACSDTKDYEVLKEKTNNNVCRMQIKLNKKIAKDELINIAKELHKSRKDFYKLWISFYQPDLLPDENGNGAWALVAFTPDIEVHIFGEEKPNKTSSKQKIIFPKYKSVMDMLKDSHDYENECLQKISKDSKILHIRVSSKFIQGESVQNMIEQVKRDIIYVIFQSFALTDINEIKVTSIPILYESLKSEKKGILQKHLKQTVNVTREKAENILFHYLKTKSFKDLYRLESTLNFYVPNAKFERLEFDKLNEVFADLRK